MIRLVRVLAEATDVQGEDYRKGRYQKPVRRNGSGL